MRTRQDAGDSAATPGTRRRRRFPGGWLGLLLLIPLGLLTGAAGAGFALLKMDLAGLPSVDGLLKVEPARATLLYCSDGPELARLYEENRITIPYEDIPKQVTDAVVATEDQRFWQHWGIDLFGVSRAVFTDVVSGSFKQGGSTITQQLARSLFLTNEVTVERKVKEALLALRIERAFTKEEIVTLYLNQVYFGEGAYGIEVAAEVFFGKHAHDLTLGESALLIGLVKNPRGYSPRHNPDRALARRELVLNAMRETHAITRDQEEIAAAERLHLAVRQRRYRQAPHFVEMVRQYLEETYGNDAIYRGGLRVYTTIDSRLEAAAESSVVNGLAERETELPYRARVRAAAEGASKARTPLQGALIALDPSTGAIRALVGGRDFYDSNFNRITQAMRQPGSGFKLFVYAAALEHGYTAGSVLDDRPISIPLPEGGAYAPHNYDLEYRGRITLRQAVSHSVNVPAVEVLMDVGAESVIETARRMGISAPIKPYPSMALGSFELKPMELVTAYNSVFNGGMLVQPFTILRIEDRSGRVLEKAAPRVTRALSPETAWMASDLLASVVESGTGNPARRDGLVGYAAGKTGTTDDCTDAWFTGYVPGLTTCVWVGYDLKQSLGAKQTGGKVALPIWTAFMKAALNRLPAGDGPARPAGVVRGRICAVSGQLAGPNCPTVITEPVLASALSGPTCAYHERRGHRQELPLPRWRQSPS